MREEYKKNLKYQKKTIKKIKKNAIKIIISIFLACAGLFGIKGALVADFLAPVVGAELSVLIAIIVKAGLMVGGVSGTIVSIADYSKDSEDLENSIEENEAIVDLINNELDKEKEKTLKLSEELHKTKSKQNDNRQSIETDYSKDVDGEYSREPKHKVKTK